MPDGAVFHKEFDNLSQLQDCRNPSDPFALHKAALIACGVIPVAGVETAADLTEGNGVDAAKGAAAIGSVAECAFV